MPEHLCLFMKALRNRIAPRKVRFFGVGEYGEKSLRPHYHIALYGMHWLERPVMEASWARGFVHAGDLTMESSAYIASYVLKKIGSWQQQILDGRHPEFARMSNRPFGIGSAGAVAVADSFSKANGGRCLEMSGDVPRSVRIGGKVLPLDSYMRNQMRKALGLPKGTARGAQIHEYEFNAAEALCRMEAAKNRSAIFNSGRNRL